MEKHYNKFFDETYYTETLNNGLEVIIFHKPDFKTSVCAFGTPYGALDINQKHNGKAYHFNPGIAHFLEHKLFESKADDMMNEFSKLGANVNAFTSYRETVFYFSITGSNIDKPLNLLLDFVQDLSVTEKSVNKEKGIINQEISYYAQLPEQRLLHEAYKCLYHNFPIIYDIGGDKKSIYAITKKELDLCYKINYHPSNMVLCITSPIDPNKLIEVIRNNQNNKKFKKANIPSENNKPEPDEVKKKTYSFKMPIKTSKHVYAIKFKPNFINGNGAFKKEWAMRILLEMNFSRLNPEYQQWLDKKLINDYFGFEIDFDLDSAYVLFCDENDNAKILRKLVHDVLNKCIIDETLIDQLKHRYVGSMFDVFDEVESFNNGYIRDYLGGLDFFKALEDLNSITINDVIDAKNSLTFKHTSFITMEPKK